MIGIHTIKITPALLNQIAALDQFKGLWQGIARHSTGLQLLSDVADYGAGFARVLEPLQTRALSCDIIATLQGALFKHQGAMAYRTAPKPLVITRDGAPMGALETAAPEEIAPLMEKLVEWLNKALSERTLHPLLIAGVFSAVFLEISPFEDGNIALLRMLLLLILLKTGYAYAPYVSLSGVMNAQAEDFFAALAHHHDSLQSGAPDWSVWLSFFMGLLSAQKDTLQARLEGQGSALQTLPALSGRIMALFQAHKRLQMKEIITLTGGRRATIKLRLGELVEGGYLRRYGQARATWYSLS